MFFHCLTKQGLFGDTDVYKRQGQRIGAGGKIRDSMRVTEECSSGNGFSFYFSCNLSLIHI